MKITSRDARDHFYYYQKNKCVASVGFAALATFQFPDLNKSFSENDFRYSEQTILTNIIEN